MSDVDMTGRARSRRAKPAPDGASRTRRPPAPRTEAEPAFARREVVVQGMRITLPALRFMERLPPPSSRLR